MKIEINYKKMYNIAEKLSDDYLSNLPFPNIVIDDFFPPLTYKNVRDTFPALKSEIWKTPSNKHTVGKSVTKQGELGLKEFLFDEDQRRLFMELHRVFPVNILEKKGYFLLVSVYFS